MDVTDEEKECKQICDKLSAIEDKQIMIEKQACGRLAVTGVYLRFSEWGDALEYLQKMLSAAEYYLTTMSRSPFPTYGTAAPRKRKRSSTRKD